jgi:hypothetical protein
VKIDEHNKSIVSDSQKDSRPVAGRKPAYESRATELRQRLIVWKQMPIALRPSLRAFAIQLGTSHQILSYYLGGLDTLGAEQEAKRIRARAEAEGRPMTFRETLQAMLISTNAKWIVELRKAAKRGPLKSDRFKFLNELVRQGLPGAKEILEKCRVMTPEEEKQAQAAEKKAMFASAVLKHIERIKQAAEQGPLTWRDIEILKVLARRKCAEAKELLQKYSKNALPRPQAPQ